jgi:hypothetical protein
VAIAVTEAICPRPGGDRGPDVRELSLGLLQRSVCGPRSPVRAAQRAVGLAETGTRAGAQVSVHDPKAMANARVLFPTLRYADDVESAVRDADLVLLLTEWEQFRPLDPEPLGEVVAKRRILDGRSALGPDGWRAAGWSYRALGRP